MLNISIQNLCSDNKHFWRPMDQWTNISIYENFCSWLCNIWSLIYAQFPNPRSVATRIFHIFVSKLTVPHLAVIDGTAENRVPAMPPTHNFWSAHNKNEKWIGRLFIISWFLTMKPKNRDIKFLLASLPYFIFGVIF